MTPRSYFQTRKLSNKLTQLLRVMAPTLVALSFAGAANLAHAQGTISFSGAQTFMQTVQTFAMYAGAVICLIGLIFAGVSFMSGNIQRGVIGLFGAIFGAGVLGWGAGWISFDHGYSVTSHSSQGLTAGRVIAHFDTEGPRSLVNSRLAYVAISRASEDARIYTNDAERLGRRLATDISKTAAIDLSPQSPKSNTERAITAFRENDPTAGMAILKEQGQVHVYPSSEHRLASVALAYAAENDRAVVLAPDVRERQELTSLIRDELRQQGRLSPESHTLPVWVKQHLDNPRVAANYSPGDKIHYKMGSPAEHGIADNSDATVLSVDAKANRLSVVTRDGNEVTYNPALLRRQTDQSSIYREEQREISEGERIWVTATVQQSQLRAGDFAVVEKARSDNTLSIRTDHGKSVALSEEQARMIEYGYAVDRMPRRGIDRLIVTGEAAQLAQHRKDLAQVSGQTRDLSIYTSNDFGLAQERSLNKTVPQVGIDSSVSLPTSDISIPGYGLGR